MPDDFEHPAAPAVPDETVPTGEPPAPAADPDIEDLRQTLAAREGELAREREVRGELLQRVRAALLASDPDVEPGLVAGETLEEIEASFAAAREFVARLRQRVEARATVIPAGAPGRTPPGAVTAFEKIRAGLRRD